MVLEERCEGERPLWMGCDMSFVHGLFIASLPGAPASGWGEPRTGIRAINVEKPAGDAQGCAMGSGARLALACRVGYLLRRQMEGQRSHGRYAVSSARGEPEG